jgi:hypothetical protein
MAWKSPAESGALLREWIGSAPPAARIPARDAGSGSPSIGDSYAMRARKPRGHRAARLRYAAGWGERAPGEPLPDAAPQRPRAAHRQLAGSNRVSELRLSQIDAVERGRVGGDLEVDVETRMLETDGDLGRLEDHPVAPFRLAEVELDHRSVGREPPAIDVAGNPDDQQVGVELVGARLGEPGARAPLPPLALARESP